MKRGGSDHILRDSVCSLLVSVMGIKIFRVKNCEIRANKIGQKIGQKIGVTILGVIFGSLWGSFLGVILGFILGPFWNSFWVLFLKV